jgi:hypothetical protein
LSNAAANGKRLRAMAASTVQKAGRIHRHSGARAKLASPESITTTLSNSAIQGLWIPALASLGRNDYK